MCADRDTKRCEFKEKTKTDDTASKNLKPSPSLTIEKSTPKKILNYEDLMKKAEANSLKAEQQLTISDISHGRKPEPRRIVNITSSRSNLHNVKSKNIHKSKQGVRFKESRSNNSNQEFIVLNERKRDLRSIEEIQKELKLLRAATKSKGHVLSQTISENSNQGDQSESIEYYAKNYSSVISAIFGYDKHSYGHDDAEENDSNMEADYSTIMAEEEKSAKIAKMEDLREELKELERKRSKIALKRK